MEKHYEVSKNSEESLEAQAKEGWFPGEKYMEMRAIAIGVPRGVLPVDSVLLEIIDYGSGWNQGELLLMFAHKDFRPMDEGEPVPIVGRVVLLEEK